MRLPKWLKPIKDQTLRVARQALRQAPRTPTLEEFTSPLREECKEIVKVKGDIGYNPHCTNCGRQRGFDEKLLQCVENAEDPQPWLQQLHGELIETRKDMKLTREVVRQEGRLYDPLKRWLIGITCASGATAGGLIVKVAWDIWLRDILLNAIPWLIALL